MLGFLAKSYAGLVANLLFALDDQLRGVMHKTKFHV